MIVNVQSQGNVPVQKIIVIVSVHVQTVRQNIQPKFVPVVGTAAVRSS